jgi:hypothetical protein
LNEEEVKKRWKGSVEKIHTFFCILMFFGKKKRLKEERSGAKTLIKAVEIASHF